MKTYKYIIEGEEYNVEIAEIKDNIGEEKNKRRSLRRKRLYSVSLLHKLLKKHRQQLMSTPLPL